MLRFPKFVFLPKNSDTLGSITLAEFFDERYLPYACATKRRPELDRLVFNKHMRSTIGKEQINSLTTERLDLWVAAQRTKNYKPGTINKHIAYLTRILNMARTWGILTTIKEKSSVSKKMPMGDLKQRFLTEAEVKTALDACRLENHPYLQSFIMLLILTGARSSEARLAKWGDFNRVERIWIVPVSKNGRSRRIVLSDAALATLDQIRDIGIRLGFNAGPLTHIFINPRSRLPYKSFHLAWDRARKRAGLPDARIHDLRHTFASFLINRGATIYEVQKLLGHYHISMTERYAHLLPDTLSQRVQLVSDIFQTSR
jgi:integrase